MTTPHSAPVPRRQLGAEWIRQDADETRLSITVCQCCADRWFPPRETCSTCASSDVRHVESDPQGHVYASTVVRIGARGFRTPYVLAYVDISGVRLLAHCPRAQQALPPGTPVRLSVAPIAQTNDEIRTSYVVIPIDETITSGDAR